MSDGARILALATDAFGAGGGIAQYNRDLIAALATSPAVAIIEVRPRLQPKPIGALPPKTRQLRAVRHPILYSVNAFAAALRMRPDIVFCGHLYMAPLAALLALVFQARLVVQTHGIEVWPRPKASQRRAVEAADLVLCVSRDTRARVLDWASLAPERVVVLPNTLSESFSPGDGSRMRSNLGVDRKTVLLSISRLDAGQQYKGQDRVIRLLPRLAARGLDVVYLIGGSGDDQARLEGLAGQHGVADRVRFLGHVPDQDLPELYRTADLYLMPSSGEGFGIVFLEAMASGVPAMGLAVGGATDALIDGDAVSDSELEAAVAARLEMTKFEPEALAERVRSRFGRQAFECRAREIVHRLTAPWSMAA